VTYFSAVIAVAGISEHVVPETGGVLVSLAS
jgi:hypothetical protein